MNQLIQYSLFILLLSACGRQSSHESSQTRSGQPEHYAMTAAGTEATDPYLTVNQHGIPVLCWTEKQAGSGQYILKYAVFDTVAAKFGPAVTVSTSMGTKTSAESANKVAFKADGTIIALFGKRFDDPENRFAGAIQYSVSSNQGKTWSSPHYLHSDTSHHYGRGFFDIAILSDGEAGAIWLDGRFGEADTGSALFFARTIPGGGFGPDKIIAKSTCECCRTDLLIDSAGTIHLAYRDILYPPDRFGRQVRDMAYSFSKDNGRSFLPPVRISADNWEVEGCPHAGPSLAVSRTGVRAVWFTAGSGPANTPAGVYEAKLAGSEGGHFSQRKLLSTDARHPQLISLPGGGTAIAWDEIITKAGEMKMEIRTGEGSEEGSAGHGGHSGKGEDADHGEHSGHGEAAGHGEHTGHSEHVGHGNPVPAAASAIVLQLTAPDGKPETLYLTDGINSAHHPVLVNFAPGKLLIAWVEEEKGLPGIRYSFYQAISAGA